MKKILAVLFALLLCAALALAEEGGGLRWEDVAPQIEAAGIPGSFVSISNTGLMIWLPGSMFTDSSDQLTAQDVEDGAVCYLTAESQNGDLCTVLVSLGEEEGGAQGYAQAVAQSEGYQLVDVGLLNGMTTVLYSVADTATNAAAVFTDDSRCVIFDFAPMTNEGYAQYANMMIASIQLDE